MLTERVTDLRCPRTGSPLQLVDAVLQDGEVVAGKLVSAEGAIYPIQNGVPDFIEPKMLSATEATVRADYDRVADEIYDSAIDWQFAAMYEDEDAVRESMVDMLRLSRSAQVLETGCGTGRD